MIQITNFFFDLLDNLIALDFTTSGECPEIFTLFKEVQIIADDVSEQSYDDGGDPYWKLSGAGNEGDDDNDDEDSDDDNNDDDNSDNDNSDNDHSDNNSDHSSNNDDNSDHNSNSDGSSDEDEDEDDNNHDGNSKKRKFSESLNDGITESQRLNDQAEEDLIGLHKRHNTNYKMMLDMHFDVKTVEGTLNQVNHNMPNYEELQDVNNRVQDVRKEVEDLKGKSEKIYDLLVELKQADDRREAKSREDDANKNDKFGNHSPLEQFVIRDFIMVILPLIASVCISITNMTLYLTIALLLVIFSYVLSVFFKKIKTSH